MSSIVTPVANQKPKTERRGLRYVIRTAWLGNLHEASVHIAQSGLLKSLGGRCVARWLVGMLVRQSRWQLRQLNIPAAFDSLDDAARIAGPSGLQLVRRCREKTVDSANACSRQAIDKGNMQVALELMNETRRRGLSNSLANSLMESARQAIDAERQVRKGNWPAAISGLERLRENEIVPAWTGARIGWLKRQIDRNGNFATENAPGGLMVIEHQDDVEIESLRLANDASLGANETSRLEWSQFGFSATTPPQRLLMWIDGVGHYLLCLEPQIWLGRYVPLCGIQIPVLADIHRRHLRFARDDKGSQFIEAGAETTITPVHARLKRDDSRLVKVCSSGTGDVATRLSAGQVTALSGNCPVRIRLADSVEFEYRKCLDSEVAILSPISRHRTVPAAAATVWIQGELIVGNEKSSQIQVPGFESSVRMNFDLAGVSFSSACKLAVLSAGRGRKSTAHIRCGDISMVLETLTANQEMPAGQIDLTVRNP